LLRVGLSNQNVYFSIKIETLNEICVAEGGTAAGAKRRLQFQLTPLISEKKRRKKNIATVGVIAEALRQIGPVQS
jgi:hypothetical protein